MEKQEYMLVNDTDGSECFFVSRSLTSAFTLVEEYIDRNKGEFPMTLYRINEGIGERWIKMYHMPLN
jgi:hypothetical protein